MIVNSGDNFKFAHNVNNVGCIQYCLQPKMLATFEHELHFAPNP